MTAINELDAANRAALLAAILDDDGNLNANVTVRKNTLATLLAVSNAGDGEIAIATDTNAIVVYKGAPAVPTIFRQSQVEVWSNFSGSPTATVVPQTDGAVRDTTLVLPVGNYYIDMDISFVMSSDAPTWTWCGVQTNGGVGSFTGIAPTNDYVLVPKHGDTVIVRHHFHNLNYAWLSGVPMLSLSLWHDGVASVNYSGLQISMRAKQR